MRKRKPTVEETANLAELADVSSPEAKQAFEKMVEKEEKQKEEKEEVFLEKATKAFVKKENKFTIAYLKEQYGHKYPIDETVDYFSRDREVLIRPYERNGKTATSFDILPMRIKLQTWIKNDILIHGLFDIFDDNNDCYPEGYKTYDIEREPSKLFLQLSEHITTLKLERPHDFVRYHFALAHKLIDNKRTESKKSGTLFYIQDQKQHATERVTSMQHLAKAYDAIINFDLESAIRFGSAIGIIGAKRMSYVMLQEKLRQKADANPKQFCIALDDPDRKYIEFLYQLVSENIIEKRGTKYLYDNHIFAVTETEAIDFLNDPSNSTYVENFKKQLTRK